MLERFASSLRCVAGPEWTPPEMSCGNDVEDELALELEEPVDIPGTITSTKLAVVFDHWPTHMNLRVPRRACLKTGLQARPRGFVPSRTTQGRERILCFLSCLHLSIGCNNRCRVLGTRTVSNSSNLQPFLLSMFIDAPESTTNYVPLVSSKMVTATPKLRSARRTWPYLLLVSL